MHATFQELLSLRDGSPIAARAAQHVSACTQCQAQLERLDEVKQSLRSLPPYSPPPHIWRSIRTELDREAPRHPHRIAALSVAATALIVISLVALQARIADPRRAPSRVARLQADDGREAIGRLVERSQQLEELLQSLPPRPAVERAATSAAIDDLQSTIQVLDLQLGPAEANPRNREQERQLWDRRVRLLHSLVDVRYAEALRDAREAYPSRNSGVI